MWLRKKIKAFTLLECLFALFVISFSVMLLNGLGKVIVNQSNYLSHDTENNWLLFSQQMRYELSDSHFVKIDNNRLFVRKGNKTIAFGQYNGGDFRKTDGNSRGYQPMLFHVKETQMSHVSQLVTLKITFDDNSVKEFIYETEN